MDFIKISDIVVKDNRQREDFDGEALVELMASIRDRGLMHPPVLRREGTAMVLVAGERRIRAVEQLYMLGGTLRHANQSVGPGMVPYTDFGELDPLEAEECELDENLRRRDLTWQEHARAVARLHRLRDAQNAQRARVGGDTYIPQTVAETALEVRGSSEGSAHADTRKEIIIAAVLDTNPEVAGAKTVRDAFKILKSQEDRRENIALAASIGSDYNSASHTLIHADCTVWMRDHIDTGGEPFDVVATDPPYGMGADQFGDGGGKMLGINHSYDDSPEAWRRLMGAWCPLSFAITKPQAHAYVFCDIDRFHELKGMMENVGWYVFRTPFIIHKINSGRVPLPDRGPRRSWEMCLYAIKGNKPVTHIYPDVIPCQGDENDGHGAQKPVSLYTNLLQRSVRPGDRVLDSFCGTGPIFAAAHQLKLYATGVEADAGSYGLSLKRLKGLDQ